jgi:hypothetical protein
MEINEPFKSSEEETKSALNDQKQQSIDVIINYLTSELFIVNIKND